MGIGETMNFTKEELYEIEKVFDFSCGSNQRAFAEMVEKYGKFPDSPEGYELTEKLLKSALHLYDLYRTISAKSKAMRELQ